MPQGLGINRDLLESALYCANRRTEKENSVPSLLPHAVLVSRDLRRGLSYLTVKLTLSEMLGLTATWFMPVMTTVTVWLPAATSLKVTSLAALCTIFGFPVGIGA